MKNYRFFKVLVVVMCCMYIFGCASLQRKFTRKKKKTEKTEAIITTHDYSKELRVNELYKKHFVFWKSWQTELIERMDAGYKKRVSCYNYTMESLFEMKKYLSPEKQNELNVFIDRIKSVDKDIRKKRLSKSESYRITHLLEKTKRQIDRNFSYSKVEGFLELGSEDAD